VTIQCEDELAGVELNGQSFGTVKGGFALLGLLSLGFALTPLMAGEPFRIPARLIFPDVVDFNLLPTGFEEIPIRIKYTLASDCTLVLWPQYEYSGMPPYRFEVMVTDSSGQVVKGTYPFGPPKLTGGRGGYRTPIQWRRAHRVR